ARALCARALGRIGDSRALGALSTLVASDQEEVQQAANEAIAMLRSGETPREATPGPPAGISEPPRQQTRALSPVRDRADPPAAAPPAGVAAPRAPAGTPAPEPEAAPRRVAFNHAMIPPGTVFL